MTVTASNKGQGANVNPQTQTNVGGNAQQTTMNNEQPQTAPKAGFSFLRPSSLVETPMSKTAAAEFLIKLKKTADEVLQDNLNADMDVKLVPLDAQSADSRIQLSVLSVGARFKDPSLANGYGVGYINLLLEGSVERPAPNVVTIDGQQVEVIKTAAQADTALLRETTKRNVAVAFGLRDASKVFEALSCTVPRDFNVEDKKQVRQLLANATAAAATEMQRHNENFADLNLKSAADDATLTIQTDYHQAPTVDSTGQPVRGDIVVRMIAEPINKTGGSENAERPQLLAIVRACVNMVYAPERPQQANPYAPMMAQPNQNPFQHYVAQVILTGMEAQFALTPAAQLMALWSAMSIRDNGAWISAFENKSFDGKNSLKIGKDIDLKDIGAIGYEVNLQPQDPNAKPDLIPTKTASFTRTHLAQLIMATFKPGALMSLDVPDSGESTWYNGVFAAAAENVPAAVRTVLHAANQLTNGEFSKVWPANGEVFDQELNRGGINRIHFGYFVDGDGIKHDIREIDYLAVLNFAGLRQPKLLEEWSETFNRLNMAPEVRLHTRLKIMKMMYSEVVITGTGYRLTFTRQFLDCLATAAGKTGLKVTNVSPMYDTSTMQRTAVSFGASLLDPNQTSSFQRGGSLGGGAAASGSHYTGRWQ